jgi:hypothetical protein
LSKGANTWIPFTGSSITYQFRKGSNKGPIKVYLDGVEVWSFDAYSASNNLWRVRKTWQVSNGNHILSVRKANVTGSTTDVDAFIVNIAAPTSSVDNPDSAITYVGNNWLHETVAGTWGNTQSSSDATDNAATFTFNGEGIRYLYSKGPGRGKAQITIDGVDKGMIDLYSESVVRQQSTHWFVGAGIHTIHVAVTGQKNSAANGYKVDIDGFLVGP